MEAKGDLSRVSPGQRAMSPSRPARWQLACGLFVADSKSTYASPRLSDVLQHALRVARHRWLQRWCSKVCTSKVTTAVSRGGELGERGPNSLYVSLWLGLSIACSSLDPSPPAI